MKPYELMEYQECASCAAKPGSPQLCESCLHNRSVVSTLKSWAKTSSEASVYWKNAFEAVMDDYWQRAKE